MYVSSPPIKSRRSPQAQYRTSLHFQYIQKFLYYMKKSLFSKKIKKKKYIRALLSYFLFNYLTCYLHYACLIALKFYFYCIY